MPANREHPRRCSIGLGRRPCKSTAGSPAATSCWSPTARSPPSNSSPRNHVCVVTRLRLDANLFAFPPQKRKRRGRPPIKGKRLKKLSAVLNDPKVSWQRHRVSLWYGRTNRLVEIASGTAIWHRGGTPPVPIRWLLVRDPKGELQPQAFP